MFPQLFAFVETLNVSTGETGGPFTINPGACGVFALLVTNTNLVITGG